MIANGMVANGLRLWLLFVLLPCQDVSAKQNKESKKFPFVRPEVIHGGYIPPLTNTVSTRLQRPLSPRIPVSKAATIPTVSSSTKSALFAIGGASSSTSRRNENEHPKRRIPLTVAVSYVYLATVFTMTLIPVVLMPVVSSTSCKAAAAAGATPAQIASSASSMVTAIASVASLGGAVGRFVNGFAVQIYGGKFSSSSYLMVMAGFVTLFGTLPPQSTNTYTYAAVLAGMEFCYSIQWAACLYILSNHYLSDSSSESKTRFAKSVTSISLGSTVGILSSKALGPALLHLVSPRILAFIGALVALSGSLVMGQLVQEYPDNYHNNKSNKEPFHWSQILDSVKAIGGTKLFWLASVGHGIVYLARQADRVLGSFFEVVSGLPTSLCAGLTASVTLGFVLGLVTATRKWPSLETPQQQNRFFMQRYAMGVLACLGLAVASIPSAMTMLSPQLKAAVVVLASGLMAMAVSYQFYQFPPLIANLYGRNKAVVTSWLNGMGFLIAAPVWAITSRVVRAAPGGVGWAMAWTNIAVLFGISGLLMTKMVLPSVLAGTEKQKDT